MTTTTTKIVPAGDLKVADRFLYLGHPLNIVMEIAEIRRWDEQIVIVSAEGDRLPYWADEKVTLITTNEEN
jgi:hypothetical protein